MNSMEKLDYIYDTVRGLIGNASIVSKYIRTNIAERVEEDMYPVFTINQVVSETVKNASVYAELDTVFDLHVSAILDDYQDADELMTKSKAIYGDIQTITNAILEFGEMTSDVSREMTVDNGLFTVHFAWTIKI